MDKQLKLFAIQEPLFEEITNDWLLEYLQNEYPEMEFKKYKHFGKEVVGVTCSPKIQLYFYVYYRTQNDIHWCRDKNVYIGLDGQKNFGSFEGFGCGVDSIEEFKTEALNVVERCKKWLKEWSCKQKKSVEKGIY